MDNTNDKELLDAYLRGELSLEETATLEKHLAVDVSLKEQFDELQEIQQGIRFSALEVLGKNLVDWERSASIQKGGLEQEVSDMIRLEKSRELLGEIRGFEAEASETTPIKVRRIQPYWWGVVASFAIVVGLWYVSIPSTKKSNETLFAEYFEPYPANMIKRNTVKIDSSMLGYIAYEREDYKKAIELLSTQTDTISQFFLGVAYLGNGQAMEALVALDSFDRQGVILEDQVIWYKALAHLKLGEIDKGKELLKSEKNFVSFKQKERATIIQELQ